MALMETHNLVAHYGDFQALYGIDSYIDAGETVAVIGANGAGKSTYLNSVTGLHPGAGDAVRFEGEPIGHLRAADVVKLGIALVPEGRKLFASLSVEENLLIGGYGRKGGGYWTLATIFDLFPVLRELRGLPATALSGGQQQMVAFGRALISNPRLLLCDEVSLGLAPTIIKDIYSVLPAIKDGGAAIMLVEQDVQRALQVADRVYCFMEGRVSLAGAPAELDQAAIRGAYFGN
jgi:branched-chain amino acid transport system ATP-binding protein